MNNILILDVGTRNKLVDYFKQELLGKGNLIVADCSILAPALYEGVKHYIVPKCTNEKYIEKIQEICVKENISLVIPLLEEDLLVISKNKEELEKLGTKCLISNLDVVDLCGDKFRMFQYLNENGFKTQLTYKSMVDFLEGIARNKVKFPILVKPNRGCGSEKISIVDNIEMLKLLICSDKELIIQELLVGQEIGIDVYIDLISKEIISIFTKKKIRMKAGETDKSISFKDEELFNIISQFVEKTGLVGAIDIDVFRVNNEYYISEVNPRFGGGYLHAYACGINFPEYILNNIKGKKNNSKIGDYEEGICMMKYKDIKIIDLKMKNNLNR